MYQNFCDLRVFLGEKFDLNIFIHVKRLTFRNSGIQLSENDKCESSSPLPSPCLCSLLPGSGARNHLGRCDQHGASAAMDFSRKREQPQVAPWRAQVPRIGCSNLILSSSGRECQSWKLSTLLTRCGFSTVAGDQGCAEFAPTGCTTGARRTCSGRQNF